MSQNRPNNDAPSPDFRQVRDAIADHFRTALTEAGWTQLERIDATNPVFFGRLGNQTAVARMVLFRNGDELRALRAWKAANAPVPAVVATGSLKIAGIADPLEWFALEYVESEPAVFSEPLVRQLFTTLRLLHSIDPSEFAFTADLASHPVGTWALDQLALHADVTKLRSAMRELLHTSAPVVVHGDLTPANVLSPRPPRPETPFYIIDPYGVRGPREQDIASVIGSATEHDPTVDWFELARTAYGPFDEHLVHRWLAAIDVLAKALTSMESDREDWQLVVDELADRIA